MNDEELRVWEATQRERARLYAYWETLSPGEREVAENVARAIGKHPEATEKTPRA